MSASPNPGAIMQLGTGFWASKTLLSAVELGLFTELAGAPKTCEDIRQALGLHERGARDFLDALVALGMLNRDEGLYSNTPETDTFLDSAKPSYIGGLLEMFSDRLYRNWADLTTVLQTGVSTNDTESDDPFDVLYDSPEHLRQFLSAMTGVSLGAARACRRSFPMGRFRIIHRRWLCPRAGSRHRSLSTHPHLSGGGFDPAPRSGRSSRSIWHQTGS